ncbi:MAG TPA: class I SAM-dependent methyltransferase [Gammaproteobacteria bacterium]|nr:class I SAM-dependent methyltransferase [Gammaproteobacteria bacterium]
MENRTSFGLDAHAYREFRPVYPDALYAYLAEICTHRNAALDCATGNGQAALGLARHFARVVAVDTDAAQIATATAHERIEYVVAPAEELSTALGRFDLVTVAQGAHWFDLPKFYARLQPLLAPGAVVAIWGYSFPRIDTAVDAVLAEHLVGAVDAFWAQGNRVIMDHYRTIAFPFEEIEPPDFAIRIRWDRHAFFGFVRTWSAHKRLLAAGKPDPLRRVAALLDAAGIWPERDVRDLQFDLHLRVGRSGTAHR